MGVLMIATILGPLLGGVFTTKLTWRWCFWVNLPVCGVALVLQLFYLRMPQHVNPISATWTEIFLHMDFPGFVLLVVSMVCYTLALQWGGLEKTWRYVRYFT
jgi:MFS family permease